MIFFEVMFGFIFVVLFVLVSLLLTQTIFAMPTWKRGAAAVVGDRLAVAILVPAHNEEQGIEATVQNIKRQLRDGDRILVVADNCSDATADVARFAGAEVCVRSNLQQRGKGFALDFGVQHLVHNPPGIVIIVDADCCLHDGSVDTLALAVQQTGRPAQAYDSMRAPPGSGSIKKIAAFAWMVKNYVRALGYKRMGLPCHLMGTGMAFSWPMISTAGLANGHVVEDLKLGMDLASIGKPALYCPDAEVSSYFPLSSSGTKTQRTRWEHGHMVMILGSAPGLFFDAIRTGNLALFMLTLDMCVPPIALLTLLVLVLCALSGITAFYTGSTMPFRLTCVLLGELTTAILFCWWRYGRTIVSFRELLIAPWYILLKIPLYFGFFIRRQVEWIRTQREND